MQNSREIPVQINANAEQKAITSSPIIYRNIFGYYIIIIISYVYVLKREPLKIELVFEFTITIK